MAELKLDMKSIRVNTNAAKAQVLLIVKDALTRVADQMGE